MKYRFAVVALTVLIYLPFVHADSTNSAELCPAINCDCDALPEGEWRSKCQREESLIKKACDDNQGVPSQFCGLHGPAAAPVALSLKLQPVKPLKSIDAVKGLQRRMIILHWSIRDDFAGVKERIEVGSYGEALQVLKLLNSNIARVFKSQRRVEDVYVNADNARASRSSWKRFAKQFSKTVKTFEDYSESLWEKHKTATSKKEKRAFQVLTYSVLRTQGLLTEMMGYAYGEAEEHERAATAWRDSAKLSKSLAAKESASLGKEEYIKYYQYQSASRWNRATYHWLLDEDKKKTEEAYEHAQQHVARASGENKHLENTSVRKVADKTVAVEGKPLQKTDMEEVSSTENSEAQDISDAEKKIDSSQEMPADVTEEVVDVAEEKLSPSEESRVTALDSN